MMTDHAKERMYKKNKRAIQMVTLAMREKNPITIDFLMEKYDWCRMKAWSTLQTMWLLGLLNPEKNAQAGDQAA